MTVTSMLDKVLKIATRQSPLALWQAQYVKARLEQAHPGLNVELVPMVTRGYVILDTPLAKVGGKGLFVKELELAMLEGRADIAVHSMKDVPVEFPEGLGLVTICERDDPRDAFVSNHYASIDELPAGSVVGTSSLRRQCQLAATRPDLVIRSLRGNVGTRLSKLDNGEYDAIILAAAGLGFLGLGARPPMAEWGAMIADGMQVIFDQWWIAAIPGAAILLASLAFNLLGDGLRDILEPQHD